jgi:hypothetical protein
MTHGPPMNEAEVVKILMQEYLSARQEVLLHIQHFKTQERFATVILAVGALSISILSGQNINVFGTGVPATPGLILVFLFTISTAGYYFLFSALSSQFALQVLAERCVRLEDEMNRLLRGPYMLWERLAQLIWSNRSVLAYKMPDTAQAACSILLVSFFSVIIPLYVIAQIRCAKIDLFFMAVIHAYTFYLLAMCFAGIQIGVYSTAAVRDDCRNLFRFATRGGIQPTIDSGFKRLLLTAGLAAVLAIAFLYVVPRSGMCTYLLQK